MIPPPPNGLIPLPPNGLIPQAPNGLMPQAPNGLIPQAPNGLIPQVPLLNLPNLVNLSNQSNTGTKNENINIASQNEQKNLNQQLLAKIKEFRNKKLDKIKEMGGEIKAEGVLEKVVEKIALGPEAFKKQKQDKKLKEEQEEKKPIISDALKNLMLLEINKNNGEGFDKVNSLKIIENCLSIQYRAFRSGIESFPASILDIFKKHTYYKENSNKLNELTEDFKEKIKNRNDVEILKKLTRQCFKSVEDIFLPKI